MKFSLNPKALRMLYSTKAESITVYSDEVVAYNDAAEIELRIPWESARLAAETIEIDDVLTLKLPIRVVGASLTYSSESRVWSGVKDGKAFEAIAIEGNRRRASSRYKACGSPETFDILAKLTKQAGVLSFDISSGYVESNHGIVICIAEPE